MLDNFKFNREYRIRDKAAFDAVFKSRKRLSTPFGVLRYSINNLNHARLGVISSKKNVRFAVTRNSLRRVIREQFRLQQHQLSGYDIVFVTYKEASGASKSEFCQCLSKALNTLQKRRGEP